MISMKQAADELHISRDKLWRIIQRLNIQVWKQGDARYSYLAPEDFAQVRDAVSLRPATPRKPRTAPAP